LSHAVTSTIVTSAGRPAAIRQPTFRVRVTRGPAKGASEEVTSPRFFIGSSQAAHVRVADPTVSALHCEVICDTEGLRVRDLGSKNGLFLEGRRVVEAFLQPKDELSLGQSVVRIELQGEPCDRSLSAVPHFGKLLGGSVLMRDTFGRLERAAKSDASVLVVGETGTGKELAAEALVDQGSRRDRPFEVLDCASLSPTVMESELFGHEQGAFTGAAAARAGVFERANQGTVFLDEIGELPLDLQAKLLGALERKEVLRLGGSDWRAADVRVISATHRDLARMVNRGTFRADLYYRIAAITVRLPPLREHPEDIPGLITHFLAELGDSAAIPPVALQHLFDAEYPGNVRELRNCVARAAAGLAPEASPREDEATQADPRLEFDVEKPYLPQKEKLIDAYERSYLLVLIRQCGGNVAEAARRSGINRVHLYDLLRRRRIPLR
jgi:DNA-binding NtrC family response regulator